MSPPIPPRAPALPLHPVHPARISPGERRELRRLARRLIARDPVLGRPPAGPVRAGLGDGPRLLLPDHSGITLKERAGVPSMEYRMLALAAEGDLMALSGGPSQAFEAVWRELPGFGPVEVRVPAGGSGPLWRRCLEDPGFLARAEGRARHPRGLTVLPYMGIHGAWRLAGRLAGRTGRAVSVAAPPPWLTRRVNDKIWFSEVASALLGAAACPPQRAVDGLVPLAHELRGFAQAHEQVCVKLPSSAGSEGNLVLDSVSLRWMSLLQLARFLEATLAARGWLERFPMLTGAWEAPVEASPSIQLWIPEPGRDPVVEGVCAQVLQGATRRFVGVAPARLPPDTLASLVAQGASLGALFQELGYFGRCSLDALLVGPGLERARLRWVECNGRWGGSSIPLTLAARLSRGSGPAPFAAVAVSQLGLRPAPFPEVLARLEVHRWTPGRGEGILFLTPSRFESGRGFDMVAVAAGEARAAALARRAVEEWLGWAAPEEVRAVTAVIPLPEARDLS